MFNEAQIDKVMSGYLDDGNLRGLVLCMRLLCEVKEPSHI